MYCLYGICWGVTRSRLRKQQGIPGNIALDVFLACLLPPCVLSQQLNHLDLAESGRALATASTAQERARAAATIPTDVVPFSGRGRRLSDVAPATAAAASAAAAAAAATPAAGSSHGGSTGNSKQDN